MVTNQHGVEHKPQKSAEGSNAFYLRCAEVGYAPAYCCCLLSIAKVQSGGAVANPACVEGIKRERCLAISMRDQELEADKALYYIDRQELVVQHPQSADIETASLAPRSKKPKHTPGEFGTFADAINIAMKEHQEKAAS